MATIKNILIPGSNGRLMCTDIFYESDVGKKPVLIYAHGFNGFKDWGNFDLIAEKIAASGIVLVKFNFSHNGTTPESTEDFFDLHAFGLNNYSRELEDLKLITDWVHEAANPYSEAIDPDQIYLLGHSLGGGMSILHAAEDSRIKKLVTWASISVSKTPWGTWPANKMEEWKQKGVAYYANGRTGQQMPLYYQLVEDYQKHENRLNILTAISKLEIPVLICHGTEDPAVSIQSAHDLISAQPSAHLFTVASDHVFGRSHPWPHDYLPAPMEAVLEKTIAFLQ